MDKSAEQKQAAGVQDAVRICIVIPHYRHVVPLAGVVDALQAYGLPLLIVDDASGEEVVEKLKSIQVHHPDIELLLRQVNGGKGAAMMDGMHWAAERGYTHVLSMDADGQHDPASVPELVRHVHASPQAVLSGQPIFGDDIPAVRRHGRKLTNTLVRWVAGSNQITDAMCGLRVYPLRQVVPLFKQLSYRTRMEFDVEILVRASWAGHDVQMVDSPVIYPPGGDSHFNMLADNIRLTGMHTLLILIALLRGIRKVIGR